MRKRRNQGEEIGISLFPFLAVLLCTMGTLVVLLLVITDQARVQAEEARSAAQPTPSSQAASPEDNPATWTERATKLQSAQAALGDAVKERRTQLGYLENHTRELQAKIVELHAALAERRRLAQADDDDVAKTEAEIKRLAQRAEQAEKSLEALRRESQNRPASYSIIPYDGPNQTPRRPIFIECRRDRIILQPEGTVLTQEDFLLADDPGNPLATALRATREYLAESKSLSLKEEPYPLIIVRPDGTESYYQVRSALTGWSDFGYEMVDDDWNLKFPPSDPSLARLQERALEESRLRQQTLLALRERRTKKARFRLAAGGGIIREGGETRHGTAQIPYHAGDAGDDSDGVEGDSGAGRASPHGQVTSENGGVGGAHAAARTPGKADGLGSPSHGQGAQGATGANGAGNPSQSKRSIARRNASGRPNPNGPPHSGYYDGTSRSAKGQKSTSGGGSPGGAPGGGTGGGSSSPTSGGNSYVAGTPDVAPQPADSKAESLADKRGRDWGLRYAEPTATPVTRPLKVVCHADRIVLVSDDAKRPPREIILKAETRDSVDEVVAAVWDEIEGWGIAGKGMYWRPILAFDVQASGGGRFEDFRRLLDGSGLDVRRRATAIAAPLDSPRSTTIRR